MRRLVGAAILELGVLVGVVVAIAHHQVWRAVGLMVVAAVVPQLAARVVRRRRQRAKV